MKKLEKKHYIAFIIIVLAAIALIFSEQLAVMLGFGANEVAGL